MRSLLKHLAYCARKHTAGKYATGLNAGLGGKSFAFAGQYLFFCVAREIARQLPTIRVELLRHALSQALRNPQSVHGPMVTFAKASVS